MLVEKIYTPKEQDGDSARKSLIKSISWRVLGTLDTIVISWILTGEFTLALSIGSVEVFSKLILYFWHERLWNLVKWK